jgi:putative two-component system response regulator
MEDYDIMTREEAEKKMEVLRQIFPIVRLVRGHAVMDLDGKTGIMEDKDETETVPHCECFAFWQKNKPCSNCISQRMLEEHGQASKLEFLGEEMYQVTARYVEIDGEPYVMEMLQKQDGKNFIDEEGCKKLAGSLMKYSHMVYMDALTGVYNRRYFEDEIKNKTNTAGVAVIDMDYLKVYNDTYGHRAGDHALEMMVNVIRQNIRKTDSLIRYGGDEFLLILPEISKESFNEKLKKIQEKIHDTAIADCGNLRLSVSIGGVITRDGESIEEAVLRADRLMYFAKDQKNMVITEEKTEYLDETMREYLRTQTIKPKILIVDDSDMNREILTEILKQDYELLEAENGEVALRMLEQYGTGIALVMLDLVMPKMDGFQVLMVMNERRLLEDIPVIMISSEDSGKYISEAYGFGVSDYIRRPFDARVVYQRVLNTIKLYSKQRRLLRLVTYQIQEKERSNRIMIGILSQIVEFRNRESGPHVIHLNVISRLLLEQLIKKKNKYHLSWQEIGLIATASALHDIGKINIDEKILNKPGKLTKEEFEIMKTHTTIGAAMIGKIDLYHSERLVQLAYEICRWHHERWDGKGYPDGLKGDEIPISAQVVSVADVYDALVSERIYKKAYPHEVAIQMILNGECGNFNPLLLECMLDIQDEIRQKISVASTEDFVRDADA